MEQAIYISKLENLKYVNPRYTRLYFGNEFCQHILPSPEDLKFIIDFVKKNKLNFTLVTPFVTNKGMEAWSPVIEYAINNFFSTEVVINDWGVLRLLREKFGYSNFALGRLLVKQKRGPRILYLKDRVPQDTIQHFRKTNVDATILSDFLINNGISRVELDNLLQGIARENPLLKASLYFPYAYVTTTRHCLAACCEAERKFLRSISFCQKECQKYTFRLQHKNMPVDLFLKGNTQFFKNERLPDNLTDLNIDRLVYEPEIPM